MLYKKGNQKQWTGKANYRMVDLEWSHLLGVGGDMEYIWENGEGNDNHQYILA